MSTEPSYGDLAWLTYDDLSKLSSCEENKANKLIIIKSPPGTRMEIPDPEGVESYFTDLRKKAQDKDMEAENLLKREHDIEDKKYQINLSSKTDEVMVYTIENEENDKDLSYGPDLSKDENEGMPFDSLTNMYGK